MLFSRVSTRGDIPKSRGTATAEGKSVLLVLTSTFPRDASDSTPSFVLELAARLVSQFQVWVLTPSVRGALSEERMGGVEVRRFRYFWPRSLEVLADGAILENLRRRPWLSVQVPFLLLSEFIWAYHLARRVRPAVIHAHWFFPQGLVGVLVGKLLGIPVVVTGHGADVALRGRLWSWLRRMVARGSSAVTVVSSDLRRRLAGAVSAGGQPPLVMPMGVDTARFDAGQEPPAGETVLFVGRLAEKKGVEYLIRAFPLVLSHHPDAHLVIVGDGPLRGKLERLAAELGIQERVTFAGGRSHSELPGFYASCRVFVGPSVVTRSGDTEGLGLVFAEAMAAGRPVVATSVGGITDVVIHGRTGLLVEERSPEALAAAICRLLDSPVEAERMGVVGRRWACRKFDWRLVAARYGALLSGVANMGRDRAGSG